jgi:hypothetical protein
MEWIFKLVGRFFPNRFRKTKEQKALVEQTLLPSQVSYPGLAVAMCSGCFMVFITLTGPPANVVVFTGSNSGVINYYDPQNGCDGQ